MELGALLVAQWSWALDICFTWSLSRFKRFWGALEARLKCGAHLKRARIAVMVHAVGLAWKIVMVLTAHAAHVLFFKIAICNQ